MNCPIGFLFGYDYNSSPICGECGDTLYECAEYYKTCIKKADLGSWVYATYLARQKSKKDINYKAYSCKYCGGWHIGRDFS